MMDNATVKKFQSSLNNMRAKVIDAKGSRVEGLTPLSPQKDKPETKPVKEREGKI